MYGKYIQYDNKEYNITPTIINITDWITRIINIYNGCLSILLVEKVLHPPYDIPKSNPKTNVIQYKIIILIIYYILFTITNFL